MKNTFLNLNRQNSFQMIVTYQESLLKIITIHYIQIQMQLIVKDI